MATPRGSAKNKKVGDWQQAEEERLVEELREHKCLYDLHSASYMDKHLKKRTLELLGDKLNKTPAEVREKIHNLRTSYSRYLKESAPSGSGGKRISPRRQWYLDHLGFLEKFTTHRGATDSLAVDSDDEEDARSATTDEVTSIPETPENEQGGDPDTSENLVSGQAEASVDQPNKSLDSDIVETEKAKRKASDQEYTPRKKARGVSRQALDDAKHAEQELNILGDLAESVRIAHTKSPSADQDELDIFAKHVANVLRSFPEDLRSLAQSDIELLLVRMKQAHLAARRKELLGEERPLMTSTPAPPPTIAGPSSHTNPGGYYSSPANPVLGWAPPNLGYIAEPHYTCL